MSTKVIAWSKSELFLHFYFNSDLSALSLSHAEDPTPEPPTQTDRPDEEERTVADRKRRHLEPPAPKPVAVVIVYKSLGQLLPERYDSDRRILRYSL